MKSQTTILNYQDKVQTERKNFSLVRQINFIIVHFLNHA